MEGDGDQDGDRDQAGTGAQQHRCPDRRTQPEAEDRDERKPGEPSVHAVLAKQGLRIPVSDLFGLGGRELLSAAPLDRPYRGRVDALWRRGRG
jgi:hypothetical protein